MSTAPSSPALQEVVPPPVHVELYAIETRCENCADLDVREIPKGTLLSSVACQRCGCRTLKPGHSRAR